MAKRRIHLKSSRHPSVEGWEEGEGEGAGGRRSRLNAEQRSSLQNARERE